MTNEEVVKMLTAKAECMKRESSGEDLDCNHRNCDDCELCYAQGTMGEQKEALKVAIEALQSSPSQMSVATDPISREEAIDLAYDCEDEFGKDVAFRFAYYLSQLPSAQPERKKGAWIEFDSDNDKYDEIKCNHCEKIFTVDAYHWTDIGFTKDDLKFCPHCGADMRGEQNEQRKGD